MPESTVFTWILVFFGLITCGPLLYAQLIMIRKPQSQEAKKWMIGKGEDWRDKSHFKSAYSFAIVDWLIFMPIFIGGIIGVILAQTWGYILYAAAGAIQLYINIFLWFFEKEYVYQAVGPLAYFTYIWGNFIYWGTVSLIYSILRLNGIIL
jgi:hypothetical protein